MSKINNKGIIYYNIITILSILSPIIIILFYSSSFKISNAYFLIMFIILEIINIVIVIKNIVFYNKKIEHVFLSTMLPISFAYLFLLMPNNVYDEAAHSYRAYDISKGHIISKKDKNKFPVINVPKDMLDTLNNRSYSDMVIDIKEKTNYDLKEKVENDGLGAANYSVFAYLFQAIGFVFGRIFNFDILISYYLARIFSLIIFLFVSYHALKIIPVGKKILFVYLFNPMLIQQCVSLSADCTIILLTIILITLILYYKEDITRINSKNLVLLLIISVILSLVKYAYFPLTFLNLLLLKNNKKYKKRIILIPILSTILSIITYYLLSKIYINPNSYVIANNINSSKQLMVIINNPFNYIKILFKTFYYKGLSYYLTLFGSNLGNGNIIIPRMVSIIYSIILIACLILFNYHNEFNIKEKFYVSIILIANIILIETGMYITWTAFGKDIIEGVQGRYFIPLLLLLIYTNFINIKFNEKMIINVIIYFTMILINLISIYYIICFFNI